MSDKQYRCRAEVDADINPQKADSKPEQPSSFAEKAANYWYYYKWHTIIGLFAAVVLAFGLAQCCTKESPDYTVIMAFDRLVPNEISGCIEDELEQFGEDINGDGKVIVHVYDVSTGTDSDMQQAQSTKLMAEMQRGEAMLFIVDDYYFNKLSALDVFEQRECFPDKDGYALNLRNSSLTDKINNIQENYISNSYYIAKRVVTGTDFEKIDVSVKSERDSLELLNKFTDTLTLTEG